MQAISLPNPFNSSLNPFVWLKDQIHDLFIGTVGLIEHLIINPPRPKPGPWQAFLYGNALGLAGTLAIAVTVVIIVLALFIQGRLKSLVSALVVVAVIGVAGPLWFGLCAYLVGLGDDLAKAAQFYTPISGNHGGPFIVMPPIDNVIGAINGLGAVTLFGVILVGIFYMYEVVVILVQFTGILVFAVSPLGARTKKLLNLLISLGLVAMVFGRATAVFCLELSKIAINNLPGGSTPFGATFFIVVGILLAIAMQYALLYVTYRGQQMIVGRVASSVRGKVETTTKQRKTVDVTSALAAHAATMKPVTVNRVGNSGPPPRTSTSTKLAKAGAAVVATKVASAHPAGAIAVLTVKTLGSSSSGKKG